MWSFGSEFSKTVATYCSSAGWNDSREKLVGTQRMPVLSPPWAQVAGICVEVAKTDYSSIHPASQASLCSPCWASVITGVTRDGQAQLCCGERWGHTKCCRLELQTRAHPLINQCPATAHRACPRGWGCFAPEAGMRKDLKATSSSPANCVKSYSRGTEQKKLRRKNFFYYIGVGRPWLHLLWISVAAFILQEIETFIFCPAQKIRIYPFYLCSELNYPSQKEARHTSYNGWWERTAAPFIWKEKVF